MDPIRTQIFISIQKMQTTGYRIEGAGARRRLDEVEKFCRSFDDGTERAMAALYDVLCETKPADATGGNYSRILTQWRADIMAEQISMAGTGGMTADEIMAMMDRPEQDPREAPKEPEPEADLEDRVPLEEILADSDTEPVE